MTTRRHIALACPLLLALPALAAEPDQAAQDALAASAPDWREAEAATLRNHVRITIPDVFHKAGEAYFGSYARWIVFQGVPAAPEGAEPDPFYSMFVAKVLRDESNNIRGVENYLEVSAPGTANTCGFFDPRVPYRLIFGSTVEPYEPAENQAPGYQRASGKYQWDFPPQMEVVLRTVPAILEDLVPVRPANTPFQFPSNAITPEALWTNEGYDAECAYSPDGRFIVYTHVDSETGDADILCRDLRQRTSYPLVTAKGYDGGPFFSPDGKAICYRSDRNGDSLLQVFVAELEFDASGAPVRIKQERAVTKDEHVNWAPFWHPSGEFLAFTSSQVGHDNYEVFTVEAPLGKNADKTPETLKRKRITFSPGFDGLPAFSPDGSLMMWTSQREPDGNGAGSSQVWIAEVVDIRP